jgi:phosphoribosylformylglycinamidine synthase
VPGAAGAGARSGLNTPNAQRRYDPRVSNAADQGVRVHRVEVRVKEGMLDPKGRAAAARARELGYEVAGGLSSRVYLLEGSLSDEQVGRVMQGLLCDPVTERASVGAGEVARGASSVEVHPLPGVMDPAAQSVREAIADLIGERVEVSTGVRYDFEGVGEEIARAIAARTLANPVVHQITSGPWLPASLPKGDAYVLHKRTVPLRGLSDEALAQLSRSAHLFLSLAEMHAARDEYERLGRDPSDVELETIAQTWSEHCVHKTLKARVRYSQPASEGACKRSRGWSSIALANAERPGHTLHADGSITIDNLLRSTIAAATHELIAEGVDWALSVFKDNSGVVAFDDAWGVNIKVETHNRPSAIEPYGGAATGIGGCIRDVIATGLGAKPIASTDVFCVADHRHFTTENTETTEVRHGERGQVAFAKSSAPDPSSVRSMDSVVNPLPPGTLTPQRILREVVAGVRDYGNRMGIPTISGGVHVDDRYVGNPLVFCGCVGLIPRSLVEGRAREGDRIIALGGRTGRDGVHGATFSSAELQHTASSEFAHAVQIGNAIEEKRLLDAVLRARCGEKRHSASGIGHSPNSADSGMNAESRMPNIVPLYSALTDCGAGGFSSAIGEMGSELGARVHLDKAPVKYAGLSYTEVWISEAQERIVLSVPPANVAALRLICDEEGVELADLGEFGTPTREIVLEWMGEEVGRLSCEFLHEGLPKPVREAVWGERDEANKRSGERANVDSSRPAAGSIGASLLTLL